MTKEVECPFEEMASNMKQKSEKMEIQIMTMAAMPLVLLKKTMYEKEEQSHVETIVIDVSFLGNRLMMLKTLVLLNVEMGESMEVLYL